MATPDEAVDRFNEAFGRHPGYRALHARGRFYSATFTASPRSATLCRAAHLRGEEVPAVVRLSNGGGNPKVPDRAPDVRGLAVSFRPPGDGATDLLAQTAPRFPVRRVDDFVQLTYAAAKLRSKPWLLARFLVTHPSALPALGANARAKALVPPRSFAAVPYFPVHAYGWRDTADVRRWVRYTWLPDPSAAGAAKPDKSDREYLHHEFEKRLLTGPVRFTLRVQVAGDGDDPHDPMSVWRGAEEFDAGVLLVTRPDPAPEADGGVVVFDPTRIIDGLELSDDPILRFRPAAYSASAERRL